MSKFSQNKKFYKRKNWKEKLIGSTIYQKILRIYFLTILIGGILLTLPISQNQPYRINFFDALFTATSAFTNTGLSVAPTSSSFKFFGEFILLILIQLGGMGFLTIIIFLWAVLKNKNKITVEHRIFLHWERGSYNKVESLPTVKTGIIVLLIAELIGAFFLTIFFYFANPSNSSNSTVVNSKGDFFRALWMGIFHAVSSANNAGFDILGAHSIIPYRVGVNNLLSVVLLIEAIIGGIGYPVFHDYYQYFKKKRLGKQVSISIFSKIGIITYIFIAYIGIFLVFIFECGPSGILRSNSSKDSFAWSGPTPTLDKAWNLIYITFSSRSSGFASIDMKHLTDSTRWLLSVLMFIGASPASTGGGIRTVIIFIIFTKIFYTATGKKHLSVFNRTIDQSLVYEACNVFVLSVILVVFSVFLLMISGTNESMGDTLFEATSAFGTAGLTSGFTEKANFLGKTTLMLLMFVGQLGVSNALISITDLQSKHGNYEYVSADLRII